MCAEWQRVQVDSTPLQPRPKLIQLAIEWAARDPNRRAPTYARSRSRLPQNLGVIAGLGVSREQVERVMRLVLGSTTARLNNWQVEQLPYLSALPGRALARLAGSAALETGESAGWSAIVKVITPRDREGSSLPDSGYREVLACRSGLLTDLPGRFRAPRVYAIDDAEDRRIWLWLEDLHDVYDRSWPLQQFRTAAHDLGVFNGRYLASGPLPAEPWLNQWLRYAWAEEHAEIQRIPSYRADLERTLNLPQVGQRFGVQSVATISRLLDDQSSSCAGSRACQKRSLTTTRRSRTSSP